MFAGSKVVTVGAGADSVMVWSRNYFANKFGKNFNSSDGDVVVFMNGDGIANSAHVDGSTYVGGDIYAVLDRSSSANANLRVNYIVALGE